MLSGVVGSWMLVWITVILTVPVCARGEISVRFKAGRPLYVALGQTLVLEAEFKKQPGDVIDMVTWDQERGKDNIRLSGAHGGRISLEKDNALLRVTEVTEGDFGTYKVTVTDSLGYQQHDSIEVRKIEEPPKASIARVLECELDGHGMAQWDSPRFSWLVDGVAVTNQSALSADGSRLDLSAVQGLNYTCVIQSSLGTRFTTYCPTPTESQRCCCGSRPGLIAAGVIIVIVLCVAGLFAIKKKKNRKSSPSFQQSDDGKTNLSF